jgi:cytochrome b involved in lipid metabolism
MGKGGRAREFTLSELKSHSSPGDCWFAIKGKVYDVSKWSEHPGGPVYNSVAGTDATDAFRAFHSSIGEAYLKRFEIGDLAPEAQKAMAPNAFEKEYRELYERVKANPNFSQAK